MNGMGWDWWGVIGFSVLRDSWGGGGFDRSVEGHEGGDDMYTETNVRTTRSLPLLWQSRMQCRDRLSIDGRILHH